MKRLHARRIASACILSAASVAALAVPGAASAASTQCSGVNIGGQGSSLQKVVQLNFWNPGFNTSTDKFACSGVQGTKAKPTVVYNADGSGAGINSWGAKTGTPEGAVNGFGAANGYVGTDEPPNAEQITNIESNTSPVTKNTLMTIPVAQESIAIVFHLPAGCSATSTVAPGRLVVSNATLEGIYAGTIKTWGSFTEGGDAVTGAGCSTDTITPVARFDQSGQTHIFKQYLNLIDTGTLETASGSETWGQLSEGNLNTTWPTAAGVIKPPAKGGGEVIKLVAATAGSVGYANLAEARANASFVPPTGGANQATFWGELQNGSKGKGAKVVPTFQDPATNGDVAAIGDANCKKTAYTNNEGKPFPPPAVTAPWNNVTTSVTEKSYTLCGLTYILAFTKYSLLPGTTAAETETVKDYLQYVVDKKGGQAAILTADYLGLPKGAVDTDAIGGAAAIGF
jgi:hypothetical protein